MPPSTLRMHLKPLAGLLLGVQLGALLLELVDELGGVGGVVGAGKDGHGGLG
mgnify:CR=1 FL=1